jgi:hypothetical protein
LHELTIALGANALRRGHADSLADALTSYVLLNGVAPMTSTIKNLIKGIPGAHWLARRLGVTKPDVPSLMPQGEAGIRVMGHRAYIGGMWDTIGRLQFDYLRSQGLLPHHYFCDVACGSMRAGVHLIRYLDKGHYMGIDKEQLLISAGVEHELGEALCAAKEPQFVVSSKFEFERFWHGSEWAILG